MIDSMDYKRERILSENKDSTIAKKDEATLPSEKPPQSIDNHPELKQGSPNVSRKKLGSPESRSKSPGSTTRRVIMDTEDKRDVHNLMVTGASINGSALNIKRYSVNQYAMPVHGSTDLGPVMATTSSHNFGKDIHAIGPYV